MTDTAANTFRQKLSAGFRKLRSRGFAAKQNFACCMTCGHFEMQNEGHASYCFYHMQDADRLKELEQEGGIPHVLLCWAGDATEICRTFQEVGLLVEWNGSDDRKILVQDTLLQ